MMATIADWNAWCNFCDDVKVDPDTELSPAELAARFGRIETGTISAQDVATLMRHAEVGPE